MFAEVYDLRRQLLKRLGLLLPITAEVYAKRDVVDPIDHHGTKSSITIARGAGRPTKKVSLM
jgi:hypothetical protein